VYEGGFMTLVLIVDDSPTETYRLKEILVKNSFQTIEATNGADGVALTKQQKPAVVLMDVVMPGLNGFQATRQITRDVETKDIPVIIVTTKDQETDRIWGERQGAKGYLVKPVKEADLIDAIKKVIPA
jgi:twitching motility two-component system response regulator PilH